MDSRAQMISSAIASYLARPDRTIGPIAWANIKLGEHGQAPCSGAEGAEIDNLRLPPAEDA